MYGEVEEGVNGKEGGGSKIEGGRRLRKQHKEWAGVSDAVTWGKVNVKYKKEHIRPVEKF